MGADDGAPLPMTLSIFDAAVAAGAADVRIAFDNVRITRGRLICP